MTPRGQRGPLTYEERGIQRWVIDPETGCWNWTGRKLNGYGLDSYGRAHRVMYEKFRGPIPPKHDLHHLCHNPGCVNPDHLEPKMRSAHIRDHQRTITTERALKIRDLGAAGLPLYEISNRTGVSVPGIWKVLEGIRYPELGPAIKYEPPCALCGKRIVGRTRKARYCSPEHARRANDLKKNQRNKARRRADVVESGQELPQ